MQLTRRELTLGWCTLVALVLGLSYWLGAPAWENWRRSQQERRVLQRRWSAAERLLQQQEEVNQRLAALRKDLPRYPQREDVTAQLLKTLERMAGEHKITLLKRTPDKEKNVGDLYELAITCAWDGDLHAIVHFLYALQASGAMLEARQLTLAPGSDRPNQMSGSFTIACAYTREGEEGSGIQVEVEPAK